jgi:hypothetical protein
MRGKCVESTDVPQASGHVRTLTDTHISLSRPPKAPQRMIRATGIEIALLMNGDPQALVLYQGWCLQGSRFAHREDQGRRRVAGLFTAKICGKLT